MGNLGKLGNLLAGYGLGYMYFCPSYNRHRPAELGLKSSPLSPGSPVLRLASGFRRPPSADRAAPQQPPTTPVAPALREGYGSGMQP